MGQGAFRLSFSLTDWRGPVIGHSTPKGARKDRSVDRLAGISLIRLGGGSMRETAVRASRRCRKPVVRIG